MELTKTKLNNILKKYRQKLADHEKEWAETCRKVAMNNTETHIALPSIYDHESHNSKGNQLFKALMNEFEGYEVFVKKEKSPIHHQSNNNADIIKAYFKWHNQMGYVSHKDSDIDEFIKIHDKYETLRDTRLDNKLKEYIK